MCRESEEVRLDFKKLRYDGGMMRYVLRQGVPSGIQNSVISIGNIVVQTNINSFGAYAMSGSGAYSKIEGFVFLPIMSMSMALRIIPEFQMIAWAYPLTWSLSSIVFLVSILRMDRMEWNDG